MNSDQDRFWRRVAVKGEDECWEWQGSRKGRGYGNLTVNYVRMGAHQRAYILAIGPIPEGLFVCHTCDHPPCCNPRHLFAATQKDNVQDAINKGRFRAGRTGRLSREQVQWIREQHSAGTMTQKAMAHAVGVTPSQVCHILKGRSQVKK